MVLEALHNYVILKITEGKKQKGVIALPDSAAKAQEDFAEVVSVGPSCEGGLEEGDMVLCPECGDYEWTDEDNKDQKYMLIEETAIAARIKK